jgi:hypothetical protein
MMRAIFFLSLVGAALYGFLVVTGDALTETNSKQGRGIQAQSNPSEGERLSSWDSNLPSRSQYQNPQLASQPATSPSQKGNGASHNSARAQMATPENRIASVETEGAKPELATAGEIPNHVAAESTTEPLVTKPSVRKSSKRTRSARRGVAVAMQTHGMADGLVVARGDDRLVCLCSAKFQTVGSDNS